MSVYKHPSQKVKRLMLQPINIIFRNLQNRTKVSIWLQENHLLKLEGVISGFDEFMNIVLDKAEEVVLNKGKEVNRKKIGRILLRGDNIAVIHPIMSVTSCDTAEGEGQGQIDINSSVP